MVSHRAGKHCEEDERPRRRAVLLGASNLTRGFTTVLETAWRFWGRPLEILTAMGHGRSYGIRSAVLGRELPGIVSCDLWKVLAGRATAPTTALLTDIGNDILYEVPVGQIVDWVGWCLGELQRLDARIVMTRLPVHNLDTLTPRRFGFFSRLLFPIGPLDLDTVTERVLDLDRQLGELAQQFSVVLVEQRAEWYGWDPIHIKFGWGPVAWAEILGAWAQSTPVGLAGQPVALAGIGYTTTWLALRRLAPARKWVFGNERQRAQPAVRLGDGTTVAWY